MTTERGRRLALATALTAGLAYGAGCATESWVHRGGLPPERVAKLPEDVRASYDLFAQRCSRCHTLSRPLDANIDQLDHWRSYVARMRRQPGSGISHEDADQILVFLKYYMEERLKPKAEKGATP